MLIGSSTEVNVEQIDIRNYAKFLLQEGTELEKRELLGCLTGKIELCKKKIKLSSPGESSYPSSLSQHQTTRTEGLDSDTNQNLS
ncbi:MAG: hypothetical protein AB202_01885 [Parcubacteria bacterium C7867-007]|nr:MAG: hypothetical protein AB202_01885 [Parcubacteria bacterium C7867-007]